MRSSEDVKFAFTPVGKLSERQKMVMLKLENNAKDLATDILEFVPDSADRTHALRLLLDVKFWCTQAITHEKEAKNVGQKEDPKIAALEAKVQALEIQIKQALFETAALGQGPKTQGSGTETGPEKQ